VRVIRLPVLLCLLAFMACGCASIPLLAAMDVLNVAETGKTGYDMATGLNSRKSLVQDVSPDAQSEARLRAALDAQGGSLRDAIPMVSQGHGYVVGTYANAQELERARTAASRVKGLSVITLCLFRAGSGPASGVTDGEMRDNILRLSGVRTREVRVHVVEGNAVLVGNVRTKAEQELLLDSARFAGASSVHDYVRLYAARQGPP